MTLVPVDCLILGQQLQQHEQAAEPQQQASCKERTMERRGKWGKQQHYFLNFPHNYKPSDRVIMYLRGTLIMEGHGLSVYIAIISNVSSQMLHFDLPGRKD